MSPMHGYSAAERSSFAPEPDPTADVEVDADGRTHVRFQGTTIDDKQHTFTIRYKLPSMSEQEE